MNGLRDAWDPMTAMVLTELETGSTPSFFKSTVASVANLRAAAVLAGERTSVLAVPLLALSNAPTAKRGHSTRYAESETMASVTSPLATKAAIDALFMWPAPGISMSRPRAMEVECVAVQSDMTQPSNPSRSLRSCTCRRAV